MRIRELRKWQHMSQQELADRMGVSRSTVAMWETGTNPSADALKKLADIFGVSLDYLMERESPTTPTPEDEELWVLRDRLRHQPGMRTLFHVTRNASETDLKQAVAIIEALKRTSRGFNP